MVARRGVQLGGGAGLIVVLVVLLLGGNPADVLNILQEGGAPADSSVSYEPSTAPDDEQAQFVSVVLADTEDTWSAIFHSNGARYDPPKLVLYTDMTRTGCGLGSAASGPFYCPSDHKVYLDLGFFEELRRLGAPGDFARAYVIAHEVGHHVQNLLGTMDEVNSVRVNADRTEANKLSVMLELQADCYAGVWAYHARKARHILEQGDAEEGIGAASAVGDDRLQRLAGRAVQPDSFTHGSSKQRVSWFRTGLRTGDPAACDTFAG
jgi:predicted metalloprotease